MDGLTPFRHCQTRAAGIATAFPGQRFMVGGKKEVYEPCVPLFAAMGRECSPSAGACSVSLSNTMQNNSPFA